MTKAIRVHSAGGPDALRYEDVEIPAPSAGQIQIRQHAIGVNFIDIYFRTGLYPATAPFIIGNEGAGEVVATGAGVADFAAGDRVGYAGGLGGYAELRNLPASSAVKLPPEISYDQAAAMMLKGLTAQYLLRQTYKVKRGDTILVHAAAGGVGTILCQWGKALGARVIGTVGSADKAEVARENGADHTILYRNENFPERVKEITDGALCQVVYDGVGKATFPASLDCLAPLGVFASFGSASGPIEAFDINLLAQKGSLFATRPTLFTYTAKRDNLDRMAKDLFDVVTSGSVKVPITARFPLAEAAAAHRALEGRETTGSMILTP